MQAEDLPVVSALGIASKASWKYTADQMAVFSSELTISPNQFDELLVARVACLNQVIVGYFTIREHDSGTTELEHLFVDPVYFHRGIGGELFREAVEACRMWNIATLTIIADPNSAGFYEKLGAIKIDEHKSSIPGRTIPIFQMMTDNDRPKQNLS